MHCSHERQVDSSVVPQRPVQVKTRSQFASEIADIILRSMNTYFCVVGVSKDKSFLQKGLLV